MEKMNEILPIFSSHYSIGKSIFSLEKPEKIEENKPISIFSLCKPFKIKDLYLVESSFSGFIETYNRANELNINLRFGIKLIVCSDITNKTDDSRLTESKVVIWLKNSNSYKPAIKIFSKAATEGFYYYPRISWVELIKMWDNNLILSIDFYSGFLAQNSLKGYKATPDFGAIKPNMFVSDMDLPFDQLIKPLQEKYAKDNNLDLLDIHQIYHYSVRDWDSLCVFRCINNRSIYSKPQLDHFNSRSFCWERYCEKTNREFKNLC